MESGNGGKKGAIWHQVLAAEARQQVEVGRLNGVERSREAQCHLGQVGAVPQWLVAEQGWNDQHLKQKGDKSVRIVVTEIY